MREADPCTGGAQGGHSVRGRRPAARVRTPFAFRPALRLGRRLAFAKTGRAALIVALVGIPVAGFAGVAVVAQSTQATTQEQLRYDLGRSAAQMRVSGPDVAGMRQDPVQWQFTDTAPNSPAAGSPDDTRFVDLLDQVPAGAASIPVGSTPVVLSGPKGPVGLTAVEGSVWAPALDGHWRVLDGRAPTTSDQLMVTPATLTRLGLTIGDAVQLTDPVTKRFTIAGTVRDLGTDPDAQGVFLPWGTTGTSVASPNSAGGPEAVGQLSDLSVYLPSHAPTWSEIRGLNAHGVVVQSRPVVLDPPPARLRGASTGSTIGFYIGVLALLGVFAMFEVGLLAGAAFLVGTRADTRSYAIVTSVGGDRRFVRSIVAGSGLVLGATGAVLGVAVGTAIGIGAFRLIDNGNVETYPGLHVPVVMLLVITAAGVLAGVVSALVAARAATRINVLAALRGSLRPAAVNPRAERRRRIWAPLLIGVGALMTLACGVGVLLLNDRPVQQDVWVWVVGAGVAIGPCLVQGGVALCSPWLLALVARVSTRLGLSARLAARDARRNPVRTVPVLASVMSVVFIASVVITWTASAHAQFVRDYEYRTAVGVATTSVTISAQNGTPAGYDAELTARAADVARRVLDGDRIRVLGAVREEPGEQPATLMLPHDWAHRTCRVNDTTGCSRYLQSQDSSAPHIWTGTADDYAVLTGHRPSDAVRSALASGKAVSLWPEYAHDGTVRLDTFRNRTWNDATVLSDSRPDASVTIPAVLDVQSPRIQVGVFMTPATAERYRVPAVDGMLVTKLSHDLTPAQWDAMSSAWQSYGGADRTRSSGPSFSYETVVGAVIGTLLGLLPIRALTLRFTAGPVGATHMPFVPDWPVLLLLAIGLPLLVTAGTWLTAGRSRRVAVRRTL